MITKTSIPHIYENTYTDIVKDYLLVYNPISEVGITVLNQEATFIYKLIDGKNNVSSILSICQKSDPNAKLNDILKILNDFKFSEIIYFDKPKDKAKMFAKSSTELGVWLHITNQCNLRCTYCYVSKTSHNMDEKLGKSTLQKIITDAKKHNYKKITIKFSGGECLLQFPLVLNFVKFGKLIAKKNNINIEFVVLTNGILVSKEIANILKKEDIRAAVSLDGLEKYNDKQRVFANGSGSFRQVETGIKNLLSAKVPFNVSVTITSKNIVNVPELTKYLLKLNIPFAFNFFRENPCVAETLEGNDKKLVKYISQAYQLIYNNPPQYSLLNGILDRVSFKRPHLWTCGMGKNYIVVRHDGQIVSCQMTLEKPIGSINNNDLVNTMRKGSFIKPQSLTVDDKKPCDQCQWKYICGGGCPLLTFDQKKKYNVNSPYCAVYKALIPKALRLEAKRLIKYGM